MDLPHQFHQPAAKRRRLDEAPGLWANTTQGQIEGPHLQLQWWSNNQKACDSHLTSCATQQNFPATTPYLNPVPSRFEARSVPSNFNGQLSSQTPQSYQTHSVSGGESHNFQPTAAWCQPRQSEYLPSAYSRPVNVLTPPPAFLPHHAIPPHLAQAHSLTSVLTPCHQYSATSFQATFNSQQSSIPSASESLPPLFADNETAIQSFDSSALSVSDQRDKDQSEMVCFGMVNTCILPNKRSWANICRSRPSLVDVDGKIREIFLHPFQSS